MSTALPKQTAVAGPEPAAASPAERGGVAVSAGAVDPGGVPRSTAHVVDAGAPAAQGGAAPQVRVEPVDDADAVLELAQRETHTAPA